jgi:signal transduction histidine kinase
MAIIVLFLAYLQYNWLGQTSEQEYNRMQVNLRRAAFQCSTDFSRDFSDAMKSLSGTLRGSDSDVRSAILGRLKAWDATSPYPQIVTDQVTMTGVPDSSNFTPIMVDAKTSLFLFNDLSALGFPIEGRPHEIAIIKLDRGYIVDMMLPRLIHTYFESEGALAYDVVIVDRNQHPLVRMVHNDALGNLEHPDIASQFLMIPPIPLSQIPSAPFSNRNPYLPRPMDFQGPDNQMPRDGNGRHQPPMMRAPDQPVRGDLRMNRQGLYEIRILHRDGSLEQAVNNNRLRNLAISFGVLLLLGASIVFLLISVGRAQRLARQQLEFVAGVSHELRTPLSVLQSVGDNLSDGVVHEKERLRQYGGLIKNEVVRLSDMVELALAYASIQSGKRTYEFQSVDLTIVINQALREATKRLPTDRFIVDTNIPGDLPEVQGDASALQSAVENLLTNAIKYSGNEQWIAIEANVVTHDAKSFVSITVSDRGIGIPAADLPRVFKPFTRAQNAVEAQIEGSGLGLSIAIHIVHAHQGTISVKSSAGKGSVFTIELPVTPQKGEPA